MRLSIFVLLSFLSFNSFGQQRGDPPFGDVPWTYGGGIGCTKDQALSSLENYINKSIAEGWKITSSPHCFAKGNGEICSYTPDLVGWVCHVDRCGTRPNMQPSCDGTYP
jgi:hypothetical protein